MLMSFQVLHFRLGCRENKAEFVSPNTFAVPGAVSYFTKYQYIFNSTTVHIVHLF